MFGVAVIVPPVWALGDPGPLRRGRHVAEFQQCGWMEGGVDVNPDNAGGWEVVSGAGQRGGW